MDRGLQYLHPDIYMGQSLEDWELDPMFEMDIPVPDTRDLIYAALGLSLGVALGLLFRRK